MFLNINAPTRLVGVCRVLLKLLPVFSSLRNSASLAGDSWSENWADRYFMKEPGCWVCPWEC